MLRLIALASAVLVLSGSAQAGEAFTIFEAINQAVQTNPGVGEAAANRRATETDLRQTQGTLLPQVRLDVRSGPNRFIQDVTPPPLGNGQSLTGNSASIVVRQVLFDGLSSLNDIWQQSARVDAAAHRVLERTELIALDAAEAYIDVIRYTNLIAVAQNNVEAHRRIAANVEARFAGGRTGEGDQQTARERVAATEAVLADFRQSLDLARAKYRKTVGLEPFNLRAPGRLGGMPASKDDSLAVALRFNPTIQAAQSDVDAARYGFHSTAGAFVPNVSLELRAAKSHDADSYVGNREETSGKVVVSWDIFRGGQDSWKRAGAAERYTEQTMKHARLQREAFEALDKAWAARTITAERVAALRRQVAADRRAISAYTKEYELGQRSLIDLLNSENQLFNALVSLESTRDVAVFADYQLLAAMGQLLSYLKTPQPIEAEALETIPIGIFPAKLPPILLKLPQTGSEPLQAAPPVVYNYAATPARANDDPFSDRWWPALSGERFADAADRWNPAALAGRDRAATDSIVNFAPSSMFSAPLPAFGAAKAD
jgi:outer membrane protein, adhesin transport system